MFQGAEPHAPSMPDDMWVAMMVDKHGEEWPTGRLWSNKDHARRDGVDTAAEWNAKRKPPPGAVRAWRRVCSLLRRKQINLVG